MLVLPLLLLPILLTSASLLSLRSQMRRQMRESLASDLAHSAAAYRNLERQRHQALGREALLLSYQPSLRALMTTGDPRTIQDEGGAYARLSGADLFALLSPDGKLVALYGEHSSTALAGHLTGLLGGSGRGSRPEAANSYVFDGQQLFEVAAQPIYFGTAEEGSVLGYVAIGSRIDDSVAREVSQTADSEIAFAVGTKIVSGTLDGLERSAISLTAEHAAGDWDGASPLTLELGDRRYLVDRIALGGEQGQPIALVVLRSMEEFRETQERLNRIVLAIGAGAALTGVLLAFWVARRLTSPLEALAADVAAVGGGDFQSRMPVSGASEIRALGGAIETMRAKNRETQAKLLGAERLATIGQMARSVSHDLRHYLASVYANAEFLAAPNLSEEERSDLLAEIHLSVQGTTDLLDSLLLFTRTGRVLHISCESIAYLADRAIHRVSKHPEASGVSIRLQSEGTAEAHVDAKKIERAIYNLVLNGCQAAKQTEPPHWVEVAIEEQAAQLTIAVSDSGPGVSESIRGRLFEPFVSANKENGIGIGLTLEATIAAEHGGGIRLGEGSGGATVLLMTLNRAAAQAKGTEGAAAFSSERRLDHDVPGERDASDPSRVP